MSDEKGRRRERFEKIIYAYFEKIIYAYIAATGAEVLSVATDLCCCVVACYKMNRPRQGPIPDAAGGIVE